MDSPQELTPAPAYRRRPLLWLRPYFLVIGLFWLLGGAALAFYGYEQSFLLLNRLHTRPGDWLMPLLSQLGDSVVAGGLVAALLWRRDKAAALVGVAAVAATGILAQMLKRNVFAEWMRPLAVFEGRELVHHFAWEAPRFHSFPSGHSMTAFAAGFALALAYRQGPVGRLYGIGLLAVGIAFTRVYMGLHFLGDILAGSALSTLVAAGLAAWLYPRLTKATLPAWLNFLPLLGLAAAGLALFLRLLPWWRA